MQNFRKKMKNNKGFSLVELIIVIAILAILVGILAPQYIKYVERSRQSRDVANVESFVSAAKVATSDPEFGPTLLGNTYVITMTPTVGTTAGSTVVTGGAELEPVFAEAIGADWAAKSLSSQEWSAAVTATIVIDAEGSSTVTYTPAEFADAMN